MMGDVRRLTNRMARKATMTMMLMVKVLPSSHRPTARPPVSAVSRTPLMSVPSWLATVKAAAVTIMSPRTTSMNRAMGFTRLDWSAGMMSSIHRRKPSR